MLVLVLDFADLFEDEDEHEDDVEYEEQCIRAPRTVSTLPFSPGVALFPAWLTTPSRHLCWTS